MGQNQKQGFCLFVCLLIQANMHDISEYENSNNWVGILARTYCIVCKEGLHEKLSLTRLVFVDTH